MLSGLANLSEMADEITKDNNERIRNFGREFGKVVRVMSQYVQAVSRREDIDGLLNLEVSAIKLRNDNLVGYLATALTYLRTSKDFDKREQVVKFVNLSDSYIKGESE